MLGYFNYTVIATYASVVFASFGIWLTLTGRPVAAVFCLLSSGILDMFDGKIARTCTRRTTEEKRFGIQIDSLSDLIAFGVLPAVIGYPLWRGSIYYGILSAFYILCALIRLAYFNVTEEIRQDEETEPRRFYTGLPVTTTSFLFPFLWCFSGLCGAGFRFVYASMLLVCGALFVSKIKIRKPHGKIFIVLCCVAGLILAGLATVYFMGGTL